MSLRPFRDISRKKTKVINVGEVKIGGDNPISVQSMTNTLTTDVKATIKQINDICEEGADLVRVSCPDKDSTFALKEITKHAQVPIIADIHFHYKRAIEAAENGAKCLRINPGNIGDKLKIHEVLSAAKNNNCSIRIGVNAGSLEKDILEKYKEPCPEALVDSALRNIKNCLTKNGKTYIEFRNELFAAFSMNKYSADFFLNELIELEKFPIKIRNELVNFYSKKLSIKRPRKLKDGRVSYNEILAKFRNPITIENELFKPEKMKIDKIHFYHFHAMPPIFEKKYPELFRKLSKKLEKSNSWKGHFLSSAFVVEACKI